MTAGHIVGRSEELDAIECFLDRLTRHPQGLLLEGPPGIGKTTLWRHAAIRARERSFVLLSCRATQAEAKVAFACLAELLGPVAGDVLPRLPASQRDALAVALVRSSAQVPAPSAHAVAAAALAALRLLAAATPLVLAIDDQQWLDRASAEALAFALGRIDDRRVGVVAAARAGERGRADRIALARAWPGRVVRVRLEPLGGTALHHVIRAHLGLGFPRPVLRRIVETTGGNPCFALELARALVESAARTGEDEPLFTAETLASLVERRLERLPADVRTALLVAATSSAPTVELVRRVVGDAADAALACAARARVVEVQEGRVRFAHPLLASAAYDAASDETRRGVHRRIAGA
ncbi:MAG: AAA family ATPase, partial [Thermodesulfobacteriota bacterium]